MHTHFRWIQWITLLSAVWAGSFVVSIAIGQSGKEPTGQMKASSAAPTPAASSVPSAHNLSARQTMLASISNRSARMTYQALWGIDDLRVSEASAGALLRFSYRVLDVYKAKALHDERSKPYLIEEKSGAVLQVPDLPKVGELRPKITPVNGKVYWMAFSNKGFVKPGNRVDVVIGGFRATGLIVH